MRKRQGFEIAKHRNRTTGEMGQCDCLEGVGTMRKHRPNESCGDHCNVCDLRRLGKRLARRKARRLLKRVNDRVEAPRVESWW